MVACRRTARWPSASTPAGACGRPMSSAASRCLCRSDRSSSPSRFDGSWSGATPGRASRGRFTGWRGGGRSCGAVRRLRPVREQRFRQGRPADAAAAGVHLAALTRRLVVWRPLACGTIRASTESGNNSVVECDLAKVEVAGSNPVSRSIFGVAAFGRSLARSTSLASDWERHPRPLRPSATSDPLTGPCRWRCRSPR